MPAKSEVLLLLIHRLLDKGAAWAPLIDKLGPVSEWTLATDFADAGTRAQEGGILYIAPGGRRGRPDRPAAGRTVHRRWPSMGGQAAGLVAQARSERIAALVRMTAVPFAGHEPTDEA
jgi:hypothetical protein